ncbi:MAG: hypothetical protein RLZ98_1433 [Pseudomonadota bacterium]|jgi:polysaccharide export outer membrane protein
MPSPDIVSAYRAACFCCVRKFIALAVIAALGSAGCALNNDLPWHEGSLRGPEAADVVKLRVGDKIDIRVYGESELTGVYEVGADGRVSLPLVGNMPAAGSSLATFRRRVVGKLSSGYMTTPSVAMSIATYRPFYVHGEVRNGGEYAFKPGLRLLDAIAAAGGFSYRAEEGYVILRRASIGHAVRVAAEDNIEILPGDNIRVPERFF